jgi:prevent-host-death family protein
VIKVNIFEVKAKLSEYLDRLEKGERVIICRRNHPVAELVAIKGARTSPRPIGGAKGQFIVPAAFFEPLPADVVDSFYPTGEPAWRAGRVAESGATYRAGRQRKK